MRVPPSLAQIIIFKAVELGFLLEDSWMGRHWRSMSALSPTTTFGAALQRMTPCASSDICSIIQLRALAVDSRRRLCENKLNYKQISISDRCWGNMVHSLGVYPAQGYPQAGFICRFLWFDDCFGQIEHSADALI